MKVAVRLRGLERLAAAILRRALVRQAARHTLQGSVNPAERTPAATRSPLPALNTPARSLDPAADRDAAIRSARGK
jgi:hypothetical protein